MDTLIQLLPHVRLRAVQSNKFKTGCLSVSFLRPLCRQEAAMNALIPSVLLWATERYPSTTAINRRLDDLYGAEVGTLCHKLGEVQTLGFYASFLDDRFAEGILAQMVDFLGELLFHPLTENGGFCEDGFENERQNLIHAIESGLDDKRTYAHDRMLRLMCPDEAYGLSHLGRAEDLEQVTAVSLYRHYQRVLESSQVEIFYLGRKPAEQVAELFRKALAVLPRGEIVPFHTEIVRRAETIRRGSEQMEVNQGQLCMGLRTGCTVEDAEFPALYLLNLILGGSAGCKLYANVREKLSLCYYVSSYLDKFKGVMGISSGVDFADFDRAEQAILAELEACRRGEISEEEFQAARQVLFSSFEAVEDSPDSLDDYYIGMAVNGAVMDFDAFRAAAGKVTVADVSRAAQKLTLDTIFRLTEVTE